MVATRPITRRHTLPGRPAGTTGRTVHDRIERMEFAPSARQQAVLNLARELEQHVSAAGWDGPVRLFALVRTADALARDADLSQRLPAEVVAAAQADPEHLTAVEQDELPEVATVDDLLGRIVWPQTVDGAALVVERIVLPPEADEQIPEDADTAAEWAAEHPERRDVRLVAAVLRDGANGCAIRARDHDSDDRVALGPDLVPELIAALTGTLTE